MVGGELHIRDTPPLIFHPEQTRDPHFQTRRLADPGELSRDTVRGSPRPARPLPAGRRGDQGRGHRQRRPAVLDRPADVVLQPPAVPAVQGGGRIGAGALCRRERLSAPRAARGDRPAPDAARLRHVPRLGHRPAGTHFYVRQLRDAKIKPLVETFDSAELTTYAQGLRLGVGPRPRQGRRCVGDQRLPRHRRPVRRGDGRLCAGLCRPGRTRPPRAAGCGQGG